MRNTRKTAFTLLMLLVPALLFSQAPAKPLSFEVATIKEAAPLNPALIASGKLPHIGMSVEGSRVDIGFLSLADLIPIAYKLKPYQISGPDWMSGQRFDIIAVLPDGATKEQVPEMLQTLLAERFQLKVHRETRDHSVYALIVGKGGSKLKESPEIKAAPAEPPKGAITMGTGTSQVSITPGSGGGATVTSPQNGTTKMTMGQGGQMRMEIERVTMPAFAEMITRFVDRPVVDMTELKGNYQVGLDLSMELMLSMARTAGVSLPALPGAAGSASASDPSGGSIFASIQELGLKLDSRKAPIEFVVVDHAEKAPTEN
jgi:uncharacterized protein (TIGR03435 family)